MGFANDIIGGAAALIRAAIKSPNYVKSSAGWSVNKDGSAEFNNVTVRGTMTAGNTVINSSGIFTYSGTPAAGNLIASQAPAGGTDSFGNKYLAGVSSYSNSTGLYTQVANGFITFGTGSLSGGWTAQSSISGDSVGDLQISTPQTLEFVSSINGFTFNGSTATGTALPAGVPTGGPNGGVFAGHTHDFDGHTHPF